MKKILLALVALLCCAGIEANAQNIVKYTCTEAAMFVPGQGWSDWIKVNHTITINLATDTMVVNGDKKVTYKMIDSTGERPTGDGGTEVIMYAVDQFNEYCTVRAVVDADGSKQIYIEYDMQGTLVYNIK
jgi:hypothetical protein